MIKQRSMHAHCSQEAPLKPPEALSQVGDQIETIKHFAEETFSYVLLILKDFPPSPRCYIQWCTGKPDFKKKCMPWFVVLASFHDVNVPTMANFKPPIVEKPVHQIPEC